MAVGVTTGCTSVGAGVAVIWVFALPVTGLAASVDAGVGDS